MKKNKKKKRKLNKFRFVIAGIIIALIAVVGVSVKNVIALRAEQVQLNKTNKELVAEKASLKEELKNVNDMNYIEEQARIQLRLIKPGEVLYIIDDEKNGEDGKDSN